MGAHLNDEQSSQFVRIYVSEIAIDYGELTPYASPTNDGRLGARVFISSIRASQLICDSDDIKSTVNLNKLHSNIDVLPIN